MTTAESTRSEGGGGVTGQDEGRLSTADSKGGTAQHLAPTADPASGAAEVVSTAGARGKFVPMTVAATIGDVRVRPLIDTGAGVSLVHVATLERLQAQGVKCVVHQ